ncbi:hypothetical protein PR048_033780 [Dryococelus australis]|uniref:BED-type domain-containing protein n=1 Tax=Dryococelus australis TaxID=614101 RepID=A0ABQ9FYY8_9NEOP|nr:hypothetical protein PR048_033780 [Dryococelus australis]
MSVVWNHFSTEADENYAVCTHCGIIITIGASQSMSNLIKHLCSKHADEISLVNPKQTIVKNKGFNAIVKHLEPRFSMPSRRHLAKEIIPTMYTEVMGRIKEDLHNVKFVGITTDIWHQFHMMITSKCQMTTAVTLHRLIQIELTSWNSSLDMLKRLQEHERVVLLVDWELDLPELRRHQWTLIGAKNELMASMKIRFSSIDEIDIFVFETLLDPRYKMTPFRKTETVENDVKAQLVLEATQMLQTCELVEFLCDSCIMVEEGLNVADLRKIAMHSLREKEGVLTSLFYKQLVAWRHMYVVKVSEITDGIRRHSDICKLFMKIVAIKLQTFHCPTLPGSSSVRV